jgi:tRNA wybutosine-synthesizing protein 1
MLPSESPAPTKLIQTLMKQKYHLVGQHSAVKKCRWLHETLVHDRPCYKQKFYGIKTHRCIQMTPALYFCTQRCLFCWRAQSGDQQLEWDELRTPASDSPNEIVEASIRAQRAILSGYKANLQADKEKLKEALTPKHAAISLTGEPTLYPQIGELIQAFHTREITTFLVSNGTMPRILAELSEEPTQLYVSACAPDRKTFIQVCRPQIPKAWENLNETLAILPSFRCPTVIRITLAQGLNMKNVGGYAEIIRKADPTYVEPKAYMHVGFSRLRIGFENTPSHKQTREFAAKLAETTGYKIVDESEESRVVLLSKLEKPLSVGK